MSSSSVPLRPTAPRLHGFSIRRILVGNATQPVWARPALLVLLVATAALYLWSLTASGYANTFYAAAVQAGTKSLKAWFFGSLDSSNFITVDKPPASLWVMVLSARIFGFSSWSLLAPQALMGVASVALVFATVRRSLVSVGAGLANVGGLVAGVALAATPAAALMFRFDNPDALLVLLMTLAGYAVVRALPKASWKWLALAGVALGFAFLTKMLQGLLVLPAFGFVYLLAARTTLPKRLLHLGIAAVALVVSAGWWVLAVTLWPADARPYIGGSTNNSVLELVFGYNGLGRIFGGSGNSGGGGSSASGSSFGGATGLQRLFSSEMGLEISWLLPAALLALVLGLVVTGRAKRTDARRAGLLLWGGWLAVTGLVFSFMSGTIHPYYTVALAPAIAGLIGVGGVLLWAARRTWLGRAGLAALIAVSGLWGFSLLSENADWLPWLRWVLVIGAVLTAAAVLLVGALRPKATRLLAVVVLTGTLFGLGGSAAYAVATASVGHSGSIPSVGSVTTSSSIGGGGGGGTAPGGGTGHTGTAPTGTRPSGTKPSGTGFSGTKPSGSAATGTGSSSATSAGATAGGGTAGGGGGTSSSAALTKLLKAAGTKWSAAIDGSQSAATLELSSGTALMAIGGWSDDPAPTLAQFEADVKAGSVHYYIAGSQGGGGGSSANNQSAILTWVKAHYTSTTVGGSTVYDLTSPK
jgi:4-amino-4-deoxy-L-arabinose transferase-like glycosyltransferase